MAMARGKRRQRIAERLIEPGNYFKLNVTCTSPVFRNDRGEPDQKKIRTELTRVLRKAADYIESGADFGIYQTIFDSTNDANDIGSFALKYRDELGNESYPEVLARR